MKWAGVCPFPEYSLGPIALRARELRALGTELPSETLVSIWPTDLISFNSAMRREYLYCAHTGHAERYTSFSRTRNAMKVIIASENRRISQFTKRPTQLFSVSTAALWTYDYLLTVGDEVGIANYNDARRNLIALCRSFTHGKRRTFSVRGPRHFSRVTLTDNVSVFSLFLFASTTHPGVTSVLTAP